MTQSHAPPRAAILIVPPGIEAKHEGEGEGGGEVVWSYGDGEGEGEGAGKGDNEDESDDEGEGEGEEDGDGQGSEEGHQDGEEDQEQSSEEAEDDEGEDEENDGVGQHRLSAEQCACAEEIAADAGIDLEVDCTMHNFGRCAHTLPSHLNATARLHHFGRCGYCSRGVGRDARVARLYIRATSAFASRNDDTLVVTAQRKCSRANRRAVKKRRRASD